MPKQISKVLSIPHSFGVTVLNNVNTCSKNFTSGNAPNNTVVYCTIQINTSVDVVLGQFAATFNESGTGNGCPSVVSDSLGVSFTALLSVTGGNPTNITPCTTSYYAFSSGHSGLDNVSVMWHDGTGTVMPSRFQISLYDLEPFTNPHLIYFVSTSSGGSYCTVTGSNGTSPGACRSITFNSTDLFTMAQWAGTGYVPSSGANYGRYNVSGINTFLASSAKGWIFTGYEQGAFSSNANISVNKPGSGYIGNEAFSIGMVTISGSIAKATLPLFCKTVNSAPSGTVTLSGGSVSPTSAPCSAAGTTTNLSVNDSSTITATVPANYLFPGAVTTNATVACGGGTCSNWNQVIYKSLTMNNSESLSIGGTNGGSKTNKSAASFTLDYGSKLFVYGTITGTYTIFQSSWIYQETTEGNQVFLNVSSSPSPYYGQNSFIWNTSAASHAKVTVPAILTVSGSSAKYIVSGQVYDINGSGLQFLGFANGGKANPPGQGSGSGNTPPITQTTTFSTSVQLNQTLPHPHPAIPPGSANSTNWAGYVVQSSNFSITDVKGSFKIPSISCSSNSFVAIWAGIDGYVSNTVEQGGVLGSCSSFGSVSYFAWFEFYPNPMNQILNMSVKAGDTIFVEIQYNQPNFFVTVSDTTQNETFKTFNANPGADANSAEWITEAPSSGSGVLALAPFGRTLNGWNYTNILGTDTLTVNSSTSQIGFTQSIAVSLVKMFDGSNQILAYPSPLTSDQGSFIVFGPTGATSLLAYIPWLAIVAIILFVVYESQKKRGNSNKLTP